MLRNIPGPSFDPTLDQVLTQPFWYFGAFLFVKICWNHYLCSVQQKYAFFTPPPPPKKNRNTVCKHNCANWKRLCVFFLHFCCLFAVSCFCRFFERNDKNKKATKLKTKQQTRKEDHKMQTTKPLSPIFKNQTTQTQNNTRQVSTMETSNTRKTNKNQNMKPIKETTL